MWSDPVGRVRGVGMIEGISFLVLLFVAMPLKYLAARPEAVLVVGWIHGVLFVAYAAVAFAAWGKGHLPTRLLGLAAVASVLPFGPFLIDRRLKAMDRAPSDTPAQAR